MKKSAFTMLELVFVIVVIGIISAMIIPRLDRDNRFEAATQVLNHIKYTQHLAMTEDVYNDAIANWFLGRWEIQFFNCGGYAVHRDIDLSANPNAVVGEAALDPQTGKSLWVGAVCAASTPTEYEKMNLATFFDLAGFAFSAGCNGNQQISFDTLGRPYSANTIHGVINQNCQVTLNFNTGAPEVIRIHPETGYACILDAAAVNCI